MCVSKVLDGVCVERSVFLRCWMVCEGRRCVMCVSEVLNDVC